MFRAFMLLCIYLFIQSSTGCQQGSHVDRPMTFVELARYAYELYCPLEEDEINRLQGSYSKKELREEFTHLIFSSTDTAIRVGSLNAMGLFGVLRESDPLFMQLLAVDTDQILRDHILTWYLYEYEPPDGDAALENQSEALSGIDPEGINSHEIIVDIPGLSKGSVPLTMVRINAGEFAMGSSSDDPWIHPNEMPQHSVQIEKDFYIGKFEFTVGQWIALMNSVPANCTFSEDPNYPVDGVSWNDITCEGGVLDQLNMLGNGFFRLPTEAEWEYACRAGTQTRFYFGYPGYPNTPSIRSVFDRYIWWKWNESGKKPVVGQNYPNSFGLHDTSGSVWEWCQDEYRTNYEDASTDGSAYRTKEGTSHVLRGGSRENDVFLCRSACRIPGDARLRYPTNGFRVVMDVPDRDE